jgi:hypothetical protein
MRMRATRRTPSCPNDPGYGASSEMPADPVRPSRSRRPRLSLACCRSSRQGDRGRGTRVPRRRLGRRARVPVRPVRRVLGAPVLPG